MLCCSSDRVTMKTGCNCGTFKTLVFRGVPFLVITWPRVSVPLNSRPVAYCRKGRTTPHLSFALCEEPSILVGTAIFYGHSQCYEYSNNYKLGVGSMGGVVIILTTRMGEWLTYGIPARYRVVLEERLEGLFFDGRRSCAGDSFAGHSSLYHGESLVVSIPLCV